MRVPVCLIVLLLVGIWFVPQVSAACAPTTIDYVAEVEYAIECPEDQLHGILGYETTGEQTAIQVCLDGCWEGCGHIIFLGVGAGTVKAEVLSVFVDPYLMVCTGTTGTLYLFG